MKSKVIAMTIEKDGITPEELESLKVFSGKNAGICYLKETFDGAEALEASNCARRFISTVKNGHHSIADHAKIEVLFENCSKMMTMILNSLQDYSTSEKSGRFTVMTGNSELEVNLYNKWKSIFEDVLLEQFPNLNDKSLQVYVRSHSGDTEAIVVEGKCAGHEDLIEEAKTKLTLPSMKIGQENARYVLSIFTKSTTFGYTTSLRQWNYIYDWIKKYLSRFDGVANDEMSYFDRNLKVEMEELCEFIKQNLYVENLRDKKNRCFDFLTSLSGNPDHPMSFYTEWMDNVAGASYTKSMICSFAVAGHIERHRTLKFFMQLDASNPTECGFYVPQFIRDTKWEDEWLRDLRSVAHLIPQATLVMCIQTGYIGDFVLMCKERLCGAAMHETMNVVKNMLEDMASEQSNDIIVRCLEECYDYENIVCKTKCEMCGECTLPCYHGAKNALTRSF